MHSPLGTQPAEGALSGKASRHTFVTCPLARRLVEELAAEALALRPAHVHAHQHLGPVLRIGAAGAGVDAHQGRVVGVRAREQEIDLLSAQVGLQGFQLSRQLAPQETGLLNGSTRPCMGPAPAGGATPAAEVSAAAAVPAGGAWGGRTTSLTRTGLAAAAALARWLLPAGLVALLVVAFFLDIGVKCYRRRGPMQARRSRGPIQARGVPPGPKRASLRARERCRPAGP